MNIDHTSQIEHHPDWYYPVPDMRVLILGTFPPHRKRWAFPFYYPNKMNRFWKILAHIAGVKLTKLTGQSAVDERKHLMKKLRIGLQNVGLVIQRKRESALDKDITILEYQDLKGLIEQHKNLKVILLTGYSGANSTYSTFIKYLKKMKIHYDVPKKITGGSEFTIYCKRPVTCIIVNSTSTAASRSVTFAMLVEQFSSAMSRV